ncbi:STAS domain-containing protein [Curvibacter sp. APW13]|uniref:STAS domain-containing protein n=1 Tax=Curvibacter sp. APW13 TaxID=3077236 RepID=UPI0028DE8E7D|nr:STAS domain-containing protein [Curvibacter sp. APW13]MDT8991842.1 STAS domain-containing protein [Curvibacter sp. APW13]
MAVKENSVGLLSKVASLIRKDEKAASDEQESRQDRGADTTQEALKARVEQKRRDDIIRRREFDYLRKIRSNGIVTSSYVAGRAQVFQSSGGYQEKDRHNTVQKINDIEAQMSRNWWARKSEELGVPAPLSRPAPLSAPKPQPKPVISSVRMGADDPPPGVDLLDGFEFATAPPTQPAALTAAGKAASTDPVVVGFVPSQSSLLDSGISGFSNSKLISIEMGVTLGDPDLQEASIRYAEGDPAGALVLLEQGFNAPEGKPESVQLYAGAIFDLHRATGAKDAFDQFALQYAERFGTSPPEWYCMPTMVRDKRAHSQASPVEQHPDEWTCPAQLELASLQALERLVERTSGVVHVHWEGVQAIADEAAKPFADLLQRWAAKPLQFEFTGTPQWMRVLKARTPGADVRTDREWWRLRLNALRVLSLLDEFEQVALDFCMVYELSPPSWEPPLCECVHEMAVAADTQAQESMMGELDGARASVFGLLTPETSNVVELVGELLGDADQALSELRDRSQGAHQLVVSCSYLIRVDFAAAGAILNWVANLEAQGCHVQFQDLSRLVAAFFNVIGINDHASVVLRTR